MCYYFWSCWQSSFQLLLKIDGRIEILKMKNCWPCWLRVSGCFFDFFDFGLTGGPACHFFFCRALPRVGSISHLFDILCWPCCSFSWGISEVDYLLYFFGKPFCLGIDFTIYRLCCRPWIGVIQADPFKMLIKVKEATISDDLIACFRFL